MVWLTLRLLARSSKLKTFSGNNPMKGLMFGNNPIIRTIPYLEQGIVLRDSIKIMMIHYGDYESNKELHEGARKLASLNFSQFQYKNPNVQILCVKNLTPTPFITFYLDNGEKFHVDIEGKSHMEILVHLQKIVGKPRELIELQTSAVEDNPANFGKNFARKCICECEGQVECTSKDNIIPFDRRQHLTGKTRNMNPKKYPFGMEEDD